MRQWRGTPGGNRPRAVRGLAAVAVLICGLLNGWAPVASAQGAIAGRGALAGGRAWQVYVPSDPLRGPGVMPVIDTATNTVTRTIAVGNEPASVALTPDGTKAYVVNMFGSDVSAVDTATGRVVATIKLDCFPVGVAIAPDGQKAYVANDCSHNVSVIDTATNKVTETIGSAGPEPEFVAITPDGAKAYVVGPHTADVPVIDTATGRISGVVATSTRYSLIAAAMSPGGKFLYVGNACCRVFVVSTATDKVVGTITTNGPKSSLDGLAITPDGKQLYVLTSALFSPASAISIIDTATGKVTGHIDNLPYLGDFPGLSFTPDGKLAYASLSDHGVAVIDPATGTIVRTISIKGTPRGPVLTPDQAPVAKMTVTAAPAGQRTGFNASASTVQFGTIASYAWNFGDGSTATTATPVTSHVYQSPGTYTVKLTETSSGGTSTTKVFTGVMMIRNGGPSAVTTAKVVISS